MDSACTYNSRHEELNGSCPFNAWKQRPERKLTWQEERIAELERQNTDLQTRNTELVEENRRLAEGRFCGGFQFPISDNLKECSRCHAVTSFYGRHSKR